MLYFLLDHKDLDVNIRNNGGRSPFNFACESLAHYYTPDEKDSYCALFEKLLQKKAIVTKEDKDTIKWEYMRSKGHDHNALKALIEQWSQATANNATAGIATSK